MNGDPIDELDEQASEIARLRAERDEWMRRSLNHALEADRYREEVINLKGRLYQKEQAS